MSEGKTDKIKLTDREFLEHLRRMSKADLARKLGVSRAAITLRSKKLDVVPETMVNYAKLPINEQKFVEDIVHGVSKTQAARNNLPQLAKHVEAANALLSRPIVRKAIEELMEEKGLGREKRVDKLKEHVDSKDEKVALKALDMSFTLADDYPAQKQVKVNVNMDWVPVDLTPYRVVEVEAEEVPEEEEPCQQE